MDQSNNFETNAIRHQTDRSQYREHSAPIYMTSSFVFEDAAQARGLFQDEIEGDIYSRFSNPNTTELVEKVCQMEGTEDGIATATGMAAMFISMVAYLKQGDHLVASRSVFGSTHQVITQILPKWGISHTYVDIHDQAGFEEAITPNTKMVFVETPSNPGLDLIDLTWLSKLCKRHQVLLNVDNCFATPYIQNPAKLGADIVTHSATKLMDGQGRVMGGLILGSKELMQEARFFLRHTGPSLSPFNAWILSKSLETLAIRVEKHCQNALALARFAEEHEEISQVRYPFLPSHPQHALAREQMRLGGNMVTFEVTGGLSRGSKFLDSLKMISFTANLGDTKTIATHPASTTHSKLSEVEQAEVGITPGLIRVSVGIEHIDDIVADVARALEASKGA